ncbi:hypothetical protein KC332_g5927 [Hortaea werneckii]|uniref:DUF6594 domain-containing protein n=2 Tax=Hortaea werneckii TaxID=91943 RepID=A0A3M7J2J2_HORWE|nr:hypothetical protein KC358_g1377 [Hortaea werneckii]OTA31595.1 hypothetical protein BTJ68_07281 [Hortaea werneckii EXF-2000]KAI6852108.1 hypothetical protein KC350_g1188 [Hortaea werneckii]KAI6936777.1 hypothetical protein KC348_g5901 [Hortaea werneckii]KAI6937348.1 hypothetical protein KC341_g5641 [Hortaea werneckii]
MSAPPATNTPASPLTANVPTGQCTDPQTPPPVPADLEAAYSELTTEEKEIFNWQYQGYQSLTKWMASSNDFFILRRFSPLQVRCLLYLQNEIAKRDQLIESWDIYAQKQPYGTLKGNSGSLSYDPYPERLTLIQQALPLIQQYNDLINSFTLLKEKQTASAHQRLNIANWFLWHPHAIDEEEQHFKGHKGDQFAILPKRRSPLVTLMRRSHWIRRVFSLRPRDDRIDDPSNNYTSGTGVEVFATILILFVGLGMTFGSIWWLNFVNDNVHRLATITASATLFTTWAWLAAGNRPFEILAAFAAYMAVLMIYRQLASGSE